MPHSFGMCTLLSIEGLENLISYLQHSCLQTCTVPFEIKGVLISDTQPDVELVHGNYQQKCLFLSNQTNPEEAISFFFFFFFFFFFYNTDITLIATYAI